MSGSPISRRTFAAHLAGGTAVLASTAAAATEKSDDEKPGEPRTGEASEADGEAKPVELVLALVRQLDPDRLTKEHLELLRLDIQFNLQRSATLSRFALTNADEPATRFAAWRAEDK